MFFFFLPFKFITCPDAGTTDAASASVASPPAASSTSTTDTVKITQSSTVFCFAYKTVINQRLELN